MSYTPRAGPAAGLLVLRLLFLSSVLLDKLSQLPSSESGATDQKPISHQQETLVPSPPIPGEQILRGTPFCPICTPPHTPSREVQIKTLLQTW